MRLADGDALTVEALTWMREGRSGETELGPGDLVLVTNGSMTAGSALGSTDTAPVLDTSGDAGSWRL